MTTLYSSYFRTDTRTGRTEQLPFCEVDGWKFGVRFERGEGIVFPEHVALRIVNRWNGLSANARLNLVYHL